MFEKSLEFYANSSIEELTQHLKSIGIEFSSDSKKNEDHSIVQPYKLGYDLDFYNYDLEKVNTKSKVCYNHTWTYNKNFNYNNETTKNQNYYLDSDGFNEYNKAG